MYFFTFLFFFFFFRSMHDRCSRLKIEEEEGEKNDDEGSFSN